MIVWLTTQPIWPIIERQPTSLITRCAIGAAPTHRTHQSSTATQLVLLLLTSAASASQASGHFGQNQPSDQQQQQKMDMHVNTRETSAKRLAT